MRGKEIITKLIIPGAIAMIICLIVHPMNRGSCLEIISCSRHFAKKRHFWNYMDHKKTERNGDQK